MKPFQKSITTLLICMFVSLSFTRCEDDKEETCQDAVCTSIFISINVTIVDQNQDPVVLDSYELINLEDNSTITLSFSASELAQFAQDGIYPVMDDLSMEENQELNIRLRGFQNSQEVVSSDYTVAKDCCHVSLVSGTTEIIVQ